MMLSANTDGAAAFVSRAVPHTLSLNSRGPETWVCLQSSLRTCRMPCGTQPCQPTTRRSKSAPALRGRRPSPQPSTHGRGWKSTQLMPDTPLGRISSSPSRRRTAMTSETDAEFLDEMEAWVTGSLVFKKEHRDRLFALARRGAGLTLYRQKLFVDRDGSEWVDEYYSRRVSLPPPPKGEEE